MAGRCSFVLAATTAGLAFSDVSGMDIKINEMKKTREDKLKYHREYMNHYRQQHKERVRAQKNAARGVMPDVFIMECF